MVDCTGSKLGGRINCFSTQVFLLERFTAATGQDSETLPSIGFNVYVSRFLTEREIFRRDVRAVPYFGSQAIETTISKKLEASYIGRKNFYREMTVSSCANVRRGELHTYR